MHKHAIVRKPGRNFADGITTSSLGIPDFEKALQQHQAYCEAIKQCLAIHTANPDNLTVLEADPKYPDGCFVEDTAIITDHVAIITQPGHPARIGEQKAIAEILSQRMPTEFITGDGYVDGGDILRADQHYFIGRSHRTNAEGARQLATILHEHGYTSSEIPVAEGLHLKSSASYLGKHTILATPAFAPEFVKYQVINVGDEDYATNCVVVNGKILFAAGFPITKQKLLDDGFQLIELEMSEFRKMDGGLTCLSLIMSDE